MCPGLGGRPRSADYPYAKPSFGPQRVGTTRVPVKAGGKPESGNLEPEGGSAAILYMQGARRGGRRTCSVKKEDIWPGSAVLASGRVGKLAGIDALPVCSAGKQTGMATFQAGGLALLV
jgi:hypothetical protein